jgi:hypothetical protein
LPFRWFISLPGEFFAVQTEHFIPLDSPGEIGALPKTRDWLACRWEVLEASGADAGTTVEMYATALGAFQELGVVGN